MKKGELRGGRVATPIREMLASNIYDGVIFHCDNVRSAESTRIAALVLRERNGYDYHTARRDNDLIVYRDYDSLFEQPIFIEVYNE